MSVLNQFTKTLTGFQSALVSESRLHPVDPGTTTLTMQTRSRRIGSETYTYSGGSKDAAVALKAELEATPGMGEVYGHSSDSDSAWTVVASIAVTGSWGAWA